MIKLLILLIFSIFFWSLSTLLSQSPLRKEVLLLLKESILILKGFFQKLIQLFLVLVKDLFISSKKDNKTITNNGYKDDFMNLVTETDYPYRISKIFKDLS
tara:strand:- start:155 stop:457 length:303 start_codon:yes stop_codon:yes gene_type:complete